MKIKFSKGIVFPVISQWTKPNYTLKAIKNKTYSLFFKYGTK